MFGNDKIDIIVKKIEIIEEQQKLCTLRHSQHDEIHVKQEEHHRRLDDKIEKSLEYQRSTDETVKSILTVMIENLPTFKRSKDFLHYSRYVKDLGGMGRLSRRGG